MTLSLRVRFAPSPTGIMHIGNVRAALINYLFAQVYQGTFILRIEDTDHVREVADGAETIMRDLAWLGIVYDEGPGKEVGQVSYFQSQRNALYEDSLLYLQQKGAVYECFCTKEELNALKIQQLESGKPPRYDGKCRQLTPKERIQKKEAGLSFTWRFASPSHQKIEVHSLERGIVVFDSSNLYDFPLTRSDGSYTFLFTNCVDDALMQITHVIRGEDHLSNTPLQLLLYQALDKPSPLFFHLPLLCDSSGKKLSKRVFGSSLRDLQNDGIIPLALWHYLVTLGGATHESVMNKQEIITYFSTLKKFPCGQIHYDIDALRALNKKYMQKLSAAELYDLVIKYDPSIAHYSKELVLKRVLIVKEGARTLKELCEALNNVCAPSISVSELVTHAHSLEQAYELGEALKNATQQATSIEQAARILKEWARVHHSKPFIPLGALRYALTGAFKGYSLVELEELFSFDEVRQRVQELVSLLNKIRLGSS